MVEDEIFGERARLLGRGIFERAGLRPDRPPRGGAVAVAESLYGPHCVHRQPRALAEGSMAIVMGSRRIYIRSELSARRAHFAVARVVARAELGRLGHFGETDLECRIAGYLAAPDETFMPLFERHGYDLVSLSARCVVTETCAALRAFEVANGDGAVVTPERVYKRGRGLGWVGDDEVRAVARARGAKFVRSVRIRDEPNRSALVPRCG